MSWFMSLTCVLMSLRALHLCILRWGRFEFDIWWQQYYSHGECQVLYPIHWASRRYSSACVILVTKRLYRTLVKDASGEVVFDINSCHNCCINKSKINQHKIPPNSNVDVYMFHYYIPCMAGVFPSWIYVSSLNHWDQACLCILQCLHPLNLCHPQVSV